MSSWTEEQMHDQELQDAYSIGAKEPRLPATVSDISYLKSRIKHEIINGQKNPLEFYVQAKLLSDLIEDLKKDSDIFDCAWSERQKYGKEKPVVSGSVVDVSSRTTYDYNSCGDHVYDELKEKLKAREQFLKSLPPEGTVDTETGNLIKPPITKESQFITVKL
jgi:hypothetical protein